MSVLNNSALAALAATIRDETAVEANTATRVGELLIDFIDSKINVDAIVKEYAATISQAGTAAPTATVVINSFGLGVLVWTRNSIGNYTGTLGAAFTTNKTFISTMNQELTVADRTVFTSVVDTNTVSMLVRKISDSSFVDLGLADSIAVNIKVYP